MCHIETVITASALSACLVDAVDVAAATASGETREGIDCDLSESIPHLFATLFLASKLPKLQALDLSEEGERESDRASFFEKQ
jgi:hypothetical protein